METIPEALFLDIFAFLEIQELFPNIGRVCKGFYRIVYSHVLLDILLKVNIRLTTNKRIPANTCLDSLKDLIQPKSHEFLEFLPCSTSGGSDEDRENFWFGNLFEYNEKP